MGESGFSSGEMALSAHELGLTDLPGTEKKESDLENAITAGRKFISEQIEGLKNFFTGPMPESDYMAYLQMVSLIGDNTIAKAKLMNMRHGENRRKTVLERIQGEEPDGTE